MPKLASYEIDTGIETEKREQQHQNLTAGLSQGTTIQRHTHVPADRESIRGLRLEKGHQGNLPALTFPIRNGAGPFGVREDRLAQSFVAMSISPYPQQPSGAFYNRGGLIKCACHGMCPFPMASKSQCNCLYNTLRRR